MPVLGHHRSDQSSTAGDLTDAQHAALVIHAGARPFVVAGEHQGLCLRIGIEPVGRSPARLGDAAITDIALAGLGAGRRSSSGASGSCKPGSERNRMMTVDTPWNLECSRRHCCRSSVWRRQRRQIFDARRIAVFVRAGCSDTACQWRIVTATPRDSGRALLAHVPRRSVRDHFIVNPSPDGRRLAFMANQKIWTMNSDGSISTPCLCRPQTAPALTTARSFTPDGQHLVFTRCAPRGMATPMMIYPTARIYATSPRCRSSTATAQPIPVPRSRPTAHGHAQPLLLEHARAIAVADIHTGPIHDLTNPALDSQQPKLVTRWEPNRVRIPPTRWHDQHRRNQPLGSPPS